MLNWEVFWQASDSPLTKAVRALSIIHARADYTA